MGVQRGAQPVAPVGQRGQLLLRHGAGGGRPRPSVAGAAGHQRGAGGGELSLDHVRLLAEANQPTREQAFARDETSLVEHCRRLPFDHARRLVDYWCQLVDAETVEADASALLDASRLHVSSNFVGQVVLDGTLDPIGGTIVRRELSRLERQLYLADRRHGRTRRPAQRRAEAMVLMAQRSAARPAGAKDARVLLTAHVGEDTVARLCELGGGRVIAPGQLVPWLGRADLETVLFDGPTTVVSVSHRRRFDGALRRAIEARDRHCQHPSGCDVPADECDVDHIVPVYMHGPTSQFNGRLECPTHNRDPDRHDAAVPAQPREITVLDELRARLRWRIRHGCSGESDESHMVGDTG
jgi:hypothetical protein